MTSRTSAMASKKVLREAVRARLAELDGESVARQSATIAGKILAMKAYKEAKSVSVYMSMNQGEVNTTKIIKDALTSGKDVYVPFIAKSSDQKASYLDMVSLHSTQDFASCEQNRDKWGIPGVTPESLPTRQRVLGPGVAVGKGQHVQQNEDDRSQGFDEGTSALDLVVVPGLAFDVECRRLGHGKGYYDHFLNSYRSTKVELSAPTSQMPHLVGLALQEQMLPTQEEIPTSSHDQPVDALIVGDGSLIERRKGL